MKSIVDEFNKEFAEIDECMDLMDDLMDILEKRKVSLKICINTLSAILCDAAKQAHLSEDVVISLIHSGFEDKTGGKDG